MLREVTLPAQYLDVLHVKLTAALGYRSPMVAFQSTTIATTITLESRALDTDPPEPFPYLTACAMSAHAAPR